MGALAGLGMGGSTSFIFQILAGILHLGTVLSSGDFDPAGALGLAAKQLGVETDDLLRTVRERRIGAKGRKSFTVVDRSPEERLSVLRSLMVMLYSRLFDYLVARINTFLNRGDASMTTKSSTGTCGILDIYGFETLTENHLDQLLINLANERLQQFFVERVLKTEQDIYLREGLSYREVCLTDRSEEISTIGFALDVLDDCGTRRRKAFSMTDTLACETMLREVAKRGKSQVICAPRLRGSARSRQGAQSGFVVSHYAGNVSYAEGGWLDRNDARPIPELESLLCDSAMPLLRSFSRGHCPLQSSLSRHYRQNLDRLISTLGRSNLQFIRCFRPNATQAPRAFDSSYVLEQLRHGGAVQLLQVMHQGFPHRVDLGEITTRFAHLLPARMRTCSKRTLATLLMHAYKIPRTEWAVGFTKLFLKAGQLRVMDQVSRDGLAPNRSTLEGALRVEIVSRWRHALVAVGFLLWLRRRARRRADLRRRVRVTGVAVLFSLRLARAAQGSRRRRQRLTRRLRSAVFSVVFIVRLRNLRRVSLARSAAKVPAVAHVSADKALEPDTSEHTSKRGEPAALASRIREARVSPSPANCLGTPTEEDAETASPQVHEGSTSVPRKSARSSYSSIVLSAPFGVARLAPAKVDELSAPTEWDDTVAPTEGHGMSICRVEPPKQARRSWLAVAGSWFTGRRDAVQCIPTPARAHFPSSLEKRARPSFCVTDESLHQRTKRQKQ